MQNQLIDLSKLSKPKPEPVTVEHPIFEEIAQALTTLAERTQVLAQQQVALTQLLVDKGVIVLDEEEVDADSSTDA